MSYDEPFDDVGEPCDTCGRRARWSVCNLEGNWMSPVVRWFACGRHLHGVLDRADWEVDSVHLYDLSGAKS